MLELRNITKTYKTGELIQNALDDVSISFRESEFVAILGHSGSGKTTMLNIIGGLDQYTTGDLIIRGVSTKRYKDKDWDAYRNHAIGFVFQNYNLIPHQTVLENVELALTLSGVSKAERKKRAAEALAQVDLAEHINKNPNQLSGGQMQRVAIARALVNNPSILLADEPTGALDSETSLQVMEILKTISKDRLVVMVTHNPELANRYASRIVKLADGRITSDSKVYISETQPVEKPVKLKNRSMSFLTATALSFKNLLTKKLRTFMTAFAGSIGIMGIALILSVSTGFQLYIDEVEEDTLSSYPLTITSETADATGAILSLVTDDDEGDGSETVKEKQYISTMFSSIETNDLASLKKYFEKNRQFIEQCTSLVTYDYSVVPNIYTVDSAGNTVKINPNNMMHGSKGRPSTSMFSTMSSSRGIFNEMLDDIEMLKTSYDVLKGRWPENYNELIIVLSEPNSISDLLVYSLGLRDFSELKTIINDAMSGKEPAIKNEPLLITYDDLLNLDLRLISNSAVFKYNEKYDIYEDMSADSDYMQNVYDYSEKLKVVGIVCLKAGTSSMALQPGVNYTKDLTLYVIEKAKQSEIVQGQLANPDIDIFSGKRFDQQDDQKPAIDFNDMIAIDQRVLKSAFKLNIDSSALDADRIQNTVAEFTMKMIASMTTDTLSARSLLESVLLELSIDMLNGYIEAYSAEGNITFNAADIDSFTEQYFLSEKFTLTLYNINVLYHMSYDILTPLYQQLLPGILHTASSVTSGVPINSSFLKEQAPMLVKLYVQTLFLADPDAPDYDPQMDMNLVFDEIASGLVRSLMANVIVTNTANLTQAILHPIMNMFSGNIMEIDTAKFAQAFQFTTSQEELSRLMETMLASTDSKTYKNNLLVLGYQDIDDPTSISIYFKNFEGKEAFADFIEQYNMTVDDKEKEISYVDITGILMGSIKTIIDAITYVLIAFVSISLIVSSIMIGVITLISVMERTKEIGILRAVGASKRDVARVFNAETIIVGLLSGIIGVVGSNLLLIPINQILYKLTKISSLKAVLPLNSGGVLIIISIALTYIAGLFPSRSASNKNPVDALRTE
ncbi:MAG TPA: ABC transporter ATP-binding protein/permease [Erysipelotrichaceae bacterium]|nr:ABC transporter ATP-binding protein/permease [Erysipelotrichaceae bacterium]